MELGLFSLSLAVKDLQKSIDFYTKLGFTEHGGGENWRIMTNASVNIGLFAGMFEDNILTFNPGWGDGATPLDEFTDVREIHAKLAEAGIEPVKDNTSESESGRAHFVITDPDGNVIMFDQHV